MKTLDRALICAMLCAASLLFTHSASAANEKQPVGVVSHVKVLSDAVADVSSMEAWKKSFITDDMTDAQKALAIWKSVCMFRHQNDPPNEYLQNEYNVHDPIKTFNVYGYSMCCCAASNVECLARYLGLKARGWAQPGHSLPEIFYDNAWHMFDASMMVYYLKDDMKTIAGVEDLHANPQGLVNREHCPLADADGKYPAGTHGVDGSRGVYGGQGFLYEFGYSQGYEVNIQLKKGMRLIRNWANSSLFANMDESGGPGCLKQQNGAGDMGYTKKLGDLAPGRVGNGTLAYTIPLHDPDIRAAFLSAENVGFIGEDRRGPAAHVKDPAKPGELVLHMPCSFVYLTGALDVKGSAGDGRVAVAISDNHGLDWKQVANLTGDFTTGINLSPYLLRRYDYRLKFVFTGKNAGVESIAISHDIQYSQRALPALKAGGNTITFSAGAQEGTMTYESSVFQGLAKKQLTVTDYHPVITGLKTDLLQVGETGAGSITFPIDTPGAMTRLRLGCHYRARDARDGWDIQVSYNDGKSYTTIERLRGPIVATCKYLTIDNVPAGTRHALIRFTGTQVNTACIFNYRIDADYTEPAGGFLPVKITYNWEEGGQPRANEHIASKTDDRYTITCGENPLMKSIILELAL